MLAYIKSGKDGYRVIEVEVGEDGKPILPEGAITTPPPLVDNDFMVNLTIENGEWVEIPVIVPPEVLLREARDLKNAQFSVWEQKYLNRPFVYDGNVYPNDSRFREMLNSSLGALREWGELPKFWLTADKKIIQPITKEFLDGIGKTAYNEHQDSMITAITIAGKIESAKTISEIEDIVFPEVPTVESLREELDKKEK